MYRTKFVFSSLSTGYSVIQHRTITIFFAFVLPWFSFFVSPSWGKWRKISHVGVYLNVLLMMIAGRRQRATRHRAGRELWQKKKCEMMARTVLEIQISLTRGPVGSWAGWTRGVLLLALFGLIWKRAIRKFNFFSCLSAASECVLSMYCAIHTRMLVCQRVLVVLLNVPRLTFWQSASGKQIPHWEWQLVWDGET